MALAAFSGGTLAALPANSPELPALTTDSGNPRLPGKFVWADLVTDDVPSARQFYAKLFGWTFWDAGGYMIALNDGRPLAGIFQRPRPKDRVAEPRWFGYISVGDVNRAQRAATNSGGRVLAPPQNMPKRGEQAVFADPEGAVFGVVKSRSGDPADFLPDVGDWVWIELVSRDAKKASNFYRAVAGYDIVENESARAGDYVFVSGGYARAAAVTLLPERAKAQPTWLLFVRVKDLASSLASAKQLGGKVLLEPRPDLFRGKLAVVTDPTGAAVGLLEWSQDLMKGGQ
jgi:predicted enzyme related to lactoylglutathione lyase